MKPIKLPFEIGKEYEKWEFDLDIIVGEKLKACDSYYYRRRLSFGGVGADSVEMIFCLDILQIVIIKFNKCQLDHSQHISQLMTIHYQKKASEIPNKEIYIISQNMELWLLESPSKLLILIYGNTQYLNKLYLT